MIVCQLIAGLHDHVNRGWSFKMKKIGYTTLWHGLFCCGPFWHCPFC